MIPLQDICSVSADLSAKNLFAEGWVHLTTTDGPSGYTHHLGLPAEDQAADWPAYAVEWLSQLDGGEIDRVAMENLPFDQPYGAKAVLEYLIGALRG